MLFNIGFQQCFRTEYFLTDYIQKIGNFNVGYIDTVFAIEGYHDLYNFNQDQLNLAGSSNVISKRRSQGHLVGEKRIYEFVFIPNSGFLNSNLPLMTNCELKLSFDRLNADHSMVQLTDKLSAPTDGKPLVIKDCVAIAEYIRSDELDNYFMKIDTTPITYNYEECDVTLRSLPLNEVNIRVDNIKGGLTPCCIFAGIIPSDNLAGNMKTSSTAFTHRGVTDFNITLNGNSVNGYPIDIKNELGIYPLQRFLDATSRYMNPVCGDSMRLLHFSYNWIYAHTFEAEVSEEGWLGIDIKLSAGYTTSHTLVIWCINDAAITIDKFHQIEKVNLL